MKLVLSIIFVLVSSSASAQGLFLAKVAKQAVLDPTTYAPAAVAYVSKQLDWNSSQPLFDVGFVEVNARFTKSGISRTVPLSYADGNKKLILDSLVLVPVMIGEIAAERVVQGLLEKKFPGQKKVWVVLGWTARLGLAGLQAKTSSSQHLQAYGDNKRKLAEYRSTEKR